MILLRFVYPLLSKTAYFRQLPFTWIESLRTKVTCQNHIQANSRRDDFLYPFFSSGQDMRNVVSFPAVFDNLSYLSPQVI